MKLKNVLIVVKDIERSRRFYHDLFGLEMILDNDGSRNADVIRLSEGVFLHKCKPAAPRIAGVLPSVCIFN